ncbi:MAG: hypothetical protein R2793_05455 [Flavobacteriaceae bacterium]
MNPIKNHILFLCFIFPLLLSGQVETLLNDIQLNESFQTVKEKLTPIVESSKIVSMDAPSFPLAAKKEVHLVCSKVVTHHGILNRVVFTFADDTLKYIEARGNAINVLTHGLNDTPRTFLDYEVYVAEKLFLKKEEDAAWILTEEAMHANLFAWENPYLNPGTDKKTEPTFSRQIPAFLTMGASLDELKPVLEANSDFISTEVLDGTDPNAQFQINCFGVDYLGFPRKIEARFGDNTLNVVWILTGKGEEERIREALVAEYGNPIFVNDAWEIFNHWQVGLRKDKPEVLLMEQQIGLAYKTSYFKQ